MTLGTHFSHRHMWPWEISPKNVFCWRRDSNPRPSDLCCLAFLTSLQGFLSFQFTTLVILRLSSHCNHYNSHRFHYPTSKLFIVRPQAPFPTAWRNNPWFPWLLNISTRLSYPTLILDFRLRRCSSVGRVSFKGSNLVQFYWLTWVRYPRETCHLTSLWLCRRGIRW